MRPWGQFYPLWLNASVIQKCVCVCIWASTVCVYWLLWCLPSLQTKCQLAQRVLYCRYAYVCVSPGSCYAAYSIWSCISLHCFPALTIKAPQWDKIKKIVCTHKNPRPFYISTGQQLRTNSHTKSQQQNLPLGIMCVYGSSSPLPPTRFITHIHQKRTHSLLYINFISPLY